MAATGSEGGGGANTVGSRAGCWFVASPGRMPASFSRFRARFFSFLSRFRFFFRSRFRFSFFSFRSLRRAFFSLLLLLLLLLLLRVLLRL